MKKLIFAAFVAGSMFATAEEAAPATAVAAPAVETVRKVPARQQITPEQRAKMREQREKFMAERKAAMEAKMLEVIKKYVPEEEKAKALVKELQEAMTAGRRMRPPRPPMKKDVEPPKVAEPQK